MYIEEPDGTGHQYGPESEQTGQMVHRLDSLIGIMMDKIDRSPVKGRVNLIVTSDHGMAELSVNRMVHIDDYLKPAWYERIVGSNPSSVFTRDACIDSVLAALRGVEHISAYRKENIPTHLRYGANKNIGDVVVIPDCGWQFTFSRKSLLGAHGYDPTHPDMHVPFYACGPDFRKNYRHPEMTNTDVYPLLARLLGITPETSDGDFERVKRMLRAE